ncbi:ribose-5-phosphate isomerase RpiA [Acuticoccus sp. 2012]|uniref:Ribose-5-phosphate isomerase A n=2 Tax=Acuticoccus mangrovi TaxID=2796142 RepID=A0A934ILH0_9HYPH|nr:ribose-5-phosphate isomerase RpiA [Acuticoccus mangrovi]MBJ3774503.1 ribose-5-phosphate isomerase RpiA [Acuticoccus mangrovi]
MLAAKREVAEAAAALVEPGMRLGLGSGSTALLFVEALGRRVAAGLTLGAVVATSQATENKARDCGIALADMMLADAPTGLDLAIDGADEVDPAFRLVKGGGACLTREKIVAAMAQRVVIIVDGTKMVEKLGRFALPVEVVPFGYAATAARIERTFGVEVVLRGDDAPLVTDNGNYILDIPFGDIADPEMVAARLSEMAGVVEHGLFIGMADEVLIAGEGGLTRRSAAR